MFDLLITGAEVVDGSADAKRFRADIAISEDKISAIGDLQSAESRAELDARGKIVAPGFIDVHNHSDGWLLKYPNFSVKTCQGFTTEVLMSDGISYAPVNGQTNPEWMHYLRPLNGLEQSDYRGWQSIADYMELIDQNTAQNVAAQIPYANLRTIACGFGSAAPNTSQREQIQRLVREGMEQGAAGLSTGLEYLSESFAQTEELVSACEPLADYNGLYVTHVRYPIGVVDGVREAVEIGKRAKIAVHISHLKGANPQQAEDLLDYINNVAVNEVDFSFDVYPYAAASTMLHYLLPYEVWVDGPSKVPAKLRDTVVQAGFAESLAELNLSEVMLAWLPDGKNKQWQGKYLNEFVQAAGIPAAEALCELLISENLAVLLVFHRGNDQTVHPFLAHDKFMLGSDGIYFPDGFPHPRMFGSAARILGPCVRDAKLFSLEDAVNKMSGYPAKRFGLQARGEIRQGNFADLVVFDASQVCDKATYSDPCATSVGVEHVIVNGELVVQNGQAIDNLTSPLPGRYLKSTRL